jgi:hypothetical protein
MHRIYFDSNDSDEHGRYLLHVNRALADLARIPGGPKEGMLITIYMIGEIEMEATLEWNARLNTWTGRRVPGTIRGNSETWDTDAQGS